MEPEDRERLVKLLGMTGSAHEGETSNAIRLANKLLQDLKLTWAEALAQARNGETPGANASNAAYLRGLAEGQQQGFALGFQQGKDRGYREGEKAGYTNGHQKGKVEGTRSPVARQDRETARREGFREGYAQGRQEAQSPPTPRPGAWQAICQEMLDQGGRRISSWEREFVTSYITRRWHTPTPRQEAVLRDIARKLGMSVPDSMDC